ncbi:MAG: hypothetical protein ACP5RE_03540 [Candidatus Acidifodinimicrobium sp.]
MIQTYFYFPLGNRSFFLRINPDSQSGKIIYPKAESLELAGEDVALILKKMVPPIFHRLGYAEEEIEKIRTILAKPVVTIDVLLNKIEDIKVYKETNEMDVTIQGHTVRLKGKDFLSPMNFQIWSASVLHMTLDITKEEWRAFVQYLVDFSQEEEEDPLSPNALDEVVRKLKMINIYDDWCDALLETWQDGVREAGLLRENKLYISTSIVDSIVKKLEINKRMVRDILSPILAEPANVVLSKKWHDVKLTKRMWVIDWGKLKSIRDVSDIKITKGEDNGI